jgi:hypothetical protein
MDCMEINSRALSHKIVLSRLFDQYIDCYISSPEQKPVFDDVQSVNIPDHARYSNSTARLNWISYGLNWRKTWKNSLMENLFPTKSRASLKSAGLKAIACWYACSLLSNRHWILLVLQFKKKKHKPIFRFASNPMSPCFIMTSKHVGRNTFYCIILLTDTAGKSFAIDIYCPCLNKIR